MLINVWSTPRTGSIHYSHILRDQYKASFINELFNRYYMTIYFTDHNGVQLNHTDYVDDSFYNDYHIENGVLASNRVYGPRIRTVPEEEKHRIKLISDIDFESHDIVMHNHVSPINDDVYNHLLSLSSKNVFLYRKDKRAQLASYAIAFSTKQFILFNSEYKHKELVADIDRIHLDNLIKRIEIYDQLIKAEEIAYEDIDFAKGSKYPIKQVDNYKVLLSERMLNIIDQIVVEYEHRKLNKYQQENEIE